MAELLGNLGTRELAPPLRELLVGPSSCMEGTVRKATWGIVAGVIGSAVGAMLLRRFTPKPADLNPFVCADEVDADYSRMAEGII
jgi:hypothetical protein